MNGILSRNSLYFWCLVPKNGKIVVNFGTATSGISCPLILVFSLNYFLLRLVPLCCWFSLAFVPFLRVLGVLGWHLCNLCIGPPVRILLIST